MSSKDLFCRISLQSHFTDIDYETDAARASHGIALGPQDSVTMDEDETTPATTSQPSRKGAALGVPAMDPEYETGAAASSAATTGPDSDDEVISLSFCLLNFELASLEFAVASVVENDVKRVRNACSIFVPDFLICSFKRRNCFLTINMNNRAVLFTR